MNFITPILHILFPAIARQGQQVLLLEHELQRTNAQYQEEAGNRKSLLTEIEYLYSILIHKNGHRYQLHILPNLPPMVHTVGVQKNKTVLVLYVPSDCKEIATVVARHIEGTMIIETIVLSEMVAMSKRVSTLLVQQLIAEARRQNVSRITDTAGQGVLPVFQETNKLSELLGISTVANI